MTLKIHPFDPRKHIRSNFGCGEISLDNYLQKQASQDIKRQVSTVFVLLDEPEMDVLGYYTLSSYTINIAALEETLAKRLPRYPLLPATLLGRLAVNYNDKGKRLGELLLIDALKRCFNTAKQVASLAIIAEALDEKAAKFYLKYGFKSFNQEPLRLYLPMNLVEEICQNFEL